MKVLITGGLMAEHTPTPWTVGVSFDYGHETRWPLYRLGNMNDPYDDDEIEANRAFIERAVYNFDGLVAALEWARCIVVDVMLYGETMKSERNALEEIDAALAKAQSPKSIQRKKDTADEVQQQDMAEETL